MPSEFRRGIETLSCRYTSAMEESGLTPSGGSPDEHTTRGILLVDSEAGPDGPGARQQLSDAIRDRGWVLSVRFGPATTVAELCLAERNESTRERWGLPTRFELVLLVARPLRGSDRELVRVLRTHAPRVRIHRWNGTAIVPWSSTPTPPAPDRTRPPASEAGADDLDGGALDAGDSGASSIRPPANDGNTEASVRVPVGEAARSRWARAPHAAGRSERHSTSPLQARSSEIGWTR